MARYLLSIASNGSLAPLEGLEPPADYLVEWSVDPTPVDGLEVWRADLQIGGSVADWAKGAAYDAFWHYVEAALARFEVRPRGVLTITSRVDPHRVAATFGYLGAHEMKRAHDDLRRRIAAAADPKSTKLKADVDLQVHA